MDSLPPTRRLLSWLKPARRPAAVARGLRLERLEDRTVPSSSIPLAGTGFKPIGGTVTGSTDPINLPAAGRIDAVAVPATPFDPANPGYTGPTDPAAANYAAFNTLYAGSPGGGVAKSTDGGVTWRFVTDNLPLSTWLGRDQNRNLVVGSLNVSPLDPNLVFAGLGEQNADLGEAGRGLLRSADGGVTWQLIQGPLTTSTFFGTTTTRAAFDTAAVTKFVFHPTNPNIVFATVNYGRSTYSPQTTGDSGDGGLYRSTDGGVTWVNVGVTVTAAGTTNNLVTDFVLDPSNPNVAYLGLGGNYGPNAAGVNTNGVYRSQNILAADPAAIVYEARLGGTSGQAGGSALFWNKVAIGAGTPTQPSRVYAIGSSGTDINGQVLGFVKAYSAMTVDSLYRSDDSGTSFRRLDPLPGAAGSTTPGISAGHTMYALQLLADPSTPNRIFVGGRGAGAIQVLTNADYDPNPASGQTPNWVNLTPQLTGTSPLTVVRDMRFDGTGTRDSVGRFTSPGRLLVATDAGLYRFQAAGGAATAGSDYTSGTAVLVSLNSAGPAGLNAQQFLSVAISPVTDNTLIGGTYANGQGVFQDNGPYPAGDARNADAYTWAAATGAGSTANGGNTIYSKIDPNLVYRVSDVPDSPTQNLTPGGLFQRSTDGGKTWTTSTRGIVNPLFVVHPAQDGLPNFGVANTTFPENGADVALVADPFQPLGQAESRLFLGTTVVNLSLDGGQNWAQFGPTVPYSVSPASLLSAVGTGLGSRSVVYVAVDDRFSNGYFGPSIYRYDNSIPSPPNQYWVDVSPGTTSPYLPGNPLGTAPSSPASNSLTGAVTQILVDPTNVNIVYAISTSATGAGRIWRGVGGGSVFVPTFVWTDITGTLPGNVAATATTPDVAGLHVYSIAQDPNRLFVNPNDPLNPINQADDDIYVGTSAGVWKLTNPTASNADGYTWTRVGGSNAATPASTGTGTQATAGAIPDSEVRDLDINTDLGVLTAATFGRGAWQVQIRPYVRGQVFLDNNGDGVVQTADKDAALSGAVVVALDNSVAPPSQFANVTSVATGEYVFRTLPNGNYTINPVDSSKLLIDPSTTYFQTNPAPINLTINGLTTLNQQNLTLFARDTISGVIYDDLNGNGTRDAGEPVRPSYPVVLVAPAGTLAATDTTVAYATADASGTYSFRGVGPLRRADGTQYPGGYVVRFAGGPRFTTTQQPAPVGPLRSGVNLTDAADAATTRVGVFQLGILTGTAFEDFNGDGAFNQTDAGRGGVTVNLTAADGTILSSAVSDATGRYTFGGLVPRAGGYFIGIVPPAGAVATTPAGAGTAVVSGTTVDGLNRGLFRLVTVTGFAFVDTNGDGVQNGDEIGAANTPVTLFDPATGAAVADAVTDADGNFQFTGVGPVPAGAGIRVGGPAEFIQTAGPTSVALVSGRAVTGLTIGVVQAATFSGVVFEDLTGNGLLDAGDGRQAGVLVQLVNTATGAVYTSATTAADGSYTLAAPPGTYRVQPTLAAATVVTTAAPTPVTVRAGQPVANQNIGAFRLNTVAGRVFLDANGNARLDAGETGAAGVTVQLLVFGTTTVARSTTTDGNGDYTFSFVGPGTYTVAVAVGSGLAASTAPATTFAATSGQVVNFGAGVFVPGTVSGAVYEDLDQTGTRTAGDIGAGGFTVQLLAVTGGAVVGTTTTDPAGAFTFAGLTPGGYQARVLPRAGYAVLNNAAQGVTLVSGQAASLAQTGVIRLGSVAGTVYQDNNRNARRDPGERGLPGGVVSLVNTAGTAVATQTADAAGAYSFVGVAAGAYTVRLATVPTGLAPTGLGLSVPVTVTAGSTSAQNVVAGVDFGAAGRKRYALAADGGGGPRVQVYDAQTNTLLNDFFAYEVTFTGGVRVASADVNGDGIDDLITVAGAGGGPRVRAFDGVTGAVLLDYFAYEPTFTNGLYVTAADVNGDGYADIITGTGPGGGPRVTVTSGKTGLILADYFAYSSDFRGGVRVGAADTDGNGAAEILTAPGVGGNPEVRVWGGPAFAQVGSFLAFDPGYTGGVYLAGASTGVGGRQDIVVGSGLIDAATPVTNATVRVFNGQSLSQTAEFEAFPGGSTAEARVAAFDRNGDGVADIAVVNGPGSPPRERFIDIATGRPIGDELQPFEFGFTGGIFLG